MEITGIQLSRTAVLHCKSEIPFFFFFFCHGPLKFLLVMNFTLLCHALRSLEFSTSMSGWTCSWNFQIFEGFIKSILVTSDLYICILLAVICNDIGFIFYVQKRFCTSSANVPEIWRTVISWAWNTSNHACMFMEEKRSLRIHCTEGLEVIFPECK
jgi:hypothetical protein